MRELTDLTDTADLAAEIADEGGIAAVRVGWLREMVDAGRVGIHVRDRIHHVLAARSIGHWPAEVPNNQDHLVLVYRTDLPAGAALTAALRLAGHERRGGDSRDTA